MKYEPNVTNVSDVAINGNLIGKTAIPRDARNVQLPIGIGPGKENRRG